MKGSKTLKVKSDKDSAKIFLSGLIVGLLFGGILGGMMTGNYILNQLLQ